MGETQTQKPIGKTFDIGKKVEYDGLYACVPCGNKKRFKKGQKFSRCFSCMRSKKYDGDKYFIDLGLWELLSD